jgi:putative addiction module killer protein
MLELKQTDHFRKWEQKLKDRSIKAIIVARIFRLAYGLPGDVKLIGEGVNELRIHLWSRLSHIFSTMWK